MVSAAAVAAVRMGSESRASAARRPPAGNALRSGQASRRTIGMITNGASITMPPNIAIVSVMPISPARAEPVALPPQ